MGKKILYVHIGTGKTGSSALQGFLKSNRKSLSELGVWYCESGMVDINHHFLCRNYFRRDDERQEVITQSLKNLREEIEKRNENCFVISSESFPGLLSSEISELKELVSDICTMHGIVYLRRQDEFLESWYAQRVKAFDRQIGIYDLKNNLYREGVLDYLSLVRLWETAGGKMTIRPYENEQFEGGDIFKDFLNILGIKEFSKLQFPKTKSNPSLGVEQAILKNSLLPFLNDKQKQFLSEPLGLPIGEKRHYLPPEEREKVLKDFSYGNKELANTYLGQEKLFVNEEISGDYFQESLVSSSYLKKLVLYMKNQKPYWAEIVEEPLVKFLKTEFDKFCESDPDYALECIFNAAMLRPDAKHINIKINNFFEK